MLGKELMNTRKLRGVVLTVIAALVLLDLLGIGKPETKTARTIMAQSQSGHTVMVPMPDGNRLATSVYLPQDGEGPWPTVLVRTPYGREVMPEFGEYGEDLAEGGIVAVIQDQRGRYDSEGEDISFFADKMDGHATLDWIVAQPWSNGRVVTEGGSAMGIMQYLLAPGASDALVCQWIEVAAPDLYADATYQGGVYRQEMIDGWLKDIGSAHLINEWRGHPLNDEFWDPVQIVDDFATVHALAFHVGGYFDVFARGIVDGFLGYQYQGGEGATGRQHLVLGPWVHAVNDPQVGEVNFQNAILPELYDLWQAQWFESCVYGFSDLAELDNLPTVTYFTMGAIGEESAPGNEWHFADTWPPEGAEEMVVYLLTDYSLDTDPPDADDPGRTFTYDPTDPSPTICGAVLMIESGMCDQQSIEERDDVLVYTSPVLDEPLEVTGDLRAEIWFTTDVPDTDIAVRLTDVYPDGRSMLVVDGIARARYHNSPDFTSVDVLTPDVPYLVSIDLGPTSIIFNAGHRVRVSITSSNWPRFALNPNTGADFVEDGETGQIAHTTILHDTEHPSMIILPIR